MKPPIPPTQKVSSWAGISLTGIATRDDGADLGFMDLSLVTGLPSLSIKGEARIKLSSSFLARGIKFLYQGLNIPLSMELDGAACYAGLLLAPADSFGLRPRPVFCPSGKKEGFLILFWPKFW